MATSDPVWQPRIFIIDDDPALCNALKFSLELEGFSVWTYPDGAALLGEERAPSVDCLVIDQQLPGMSGLELLSQLRQRGIATPAVLITSHPSRTVREHAGRAGVAIIEKPLLSNALSEEIRRLVALRPAAPRDDLSTS
ncbi:MAG: response regulator [Variibacter sp.]|nr:response regulator [Variibacter sp.]